MVPRQLILTGLFVAALWPRTVFAQGFAPGPPPPHNGPPWRGTDDGLRELHELIAWTEIAIPDLRIQVPARISDGPDSLVVSWPVHVWAYARTPERLTRGVSFFFEPQVTSASGDLRWLAGMSGFVAYEGIGPLIEAGALGATDGSGVFASLGAMIGDDDALLVLLARRYFVTGDDRYDFTLEMRFPSYPLTELFDE